MRIGADAKQRAPSQEDGGDAPGGEFGCSLCSRTYQRQKDLNKHLRKEHPDEWARRKQAEAAEKSAGTH